MNPRSTVIAKTYTSKEACALADISYRQLDYWCRIGTITSKVAARGSGTRRGWSRQEVAVLAVLARIGGHVKVSQLTQLVDVVLLGWDVDTWDETTVVLVDDEGDVWRPDEAGAPAVTVAVNLGVIRADLARRELALA